jgi:RNA polymerase sigma-70 factor, ECF subfamily
MSPREEALAGAAALPLPPGTDQSVMAAARRGDRPAFDLLVRRHTPAMYRVALRIVGSPADAEDVVQDAWIAAWRALPRYRGDAAPSTWLYRIVTNSALAALRRRRPTAPLEPGGWADSPEVADPAPDPEAAALRSAAAASVHRALRVLEPGQRAALVLREFEYLSYEEVATVLDITVAAVRSRLQRARAALFVELAEHAPGPAPSRANRKEPR